MTSRDGLVTTYSTFTILSTFVQSRAKSLGAKEVIDYTQVDFSQNGKLYDIIFDTVGKVGFSRCKNSLKPAGRYLTTTPTLQILPDLLGLVRRRGKTARFMAVGLRSADAKAKDLLFIKELVEAGQFKSVIDRCYPLEQVAEAHRYVETGHKRGNVVITIAASKRGKE